MRHRILPIILITVTLHCVQMLGCGASSAEDSPTQTAVRDAPMPLDGYAGLDNLWRVTNDVYSGSTPAVPAGFDALQQLGVRTIVSVDGARPELAAAARRGMRYVHVPLAYRGIDADQRMSLTRALHELPGPIYVHCHHGHHRGPAAAALALVTTGALTGGDAIAWMQAAGTSDRYPGLYAAVSDAQPVSPSALDAIDAPIPEVAEVGGLPATMAAIDRVWDRLRLIHSARWSTPVAHPDLVPAAEAGMLTELFRGLVDEDTAHGPDFDARLKRVVDECARLEQALVSPAGVSRTNADRAMDDISRSCRSCHANYRDE